MADTKQQKIISEIVTALETIQIADGFLTDIGDNVDDWRINWQEADLPAVSVCDLEAEVLQPDDAVALEMKDVYRLRVQIRIFLKTSTRAADARKMIADVIQAIGTNQKWDDGTENLAIKTELRRAGLIPAEESFNLVGAAVEIDVFYITGIFNAFE